MLARALVAVLLLCPALALAAATAPAGATPANSSGSSAAGPPAANEGESDTPAPADITQASERPEGIAWIVGLVVFVAAALLVVGGRWWVRTRVGRVQR